MSRSLDAFLLTSSWSDSAPAQDSELVFWWHTPNGPLRQQLRQPAVCFIERRHQADAEHMAHTLGWPVRCRAVELTTFTQQAVTACYMPVSYCYRWRNLLQNQGIPCREVDVRITDRYLMERFIYGAAVIHYEEGGLTSALPAVADTDTDTAGPAYQWLSGGHLTPGSYRPTLRWLSLDIETNIPRQGEALKLYSVGLVTPTHRCVLLVEQHGAAPAAATDPSELVRLADEASVLHALNNRIAASDPDVILGWNLIQFDLDVLQQKYHEHTIPMSWGRDGSILRVRQQRNTPDRIIVNMDGRLALDGIELLRAASYQFESFSLNAVSEQLLGDSKLLTGSQRGDDIQQLYQTDLAAFSAYNLQDCDLVWRIFEKVKLLDFAIERSLMTGLALDRMGGSVAAFENLYLPRLHRAGYIAPNIGEGYQAEKSPGGYVMDSTPGLFEHVLVLDFKSLYPSIIRTFKIDPMGLIEGLATDATQALPNDHWVPGFFGGRFHQQQHILPELIRGLGEHREHAKQEGNKPLSQAIKIIMASCYGVLGSEGCRFHDTRLSASITKRSHEIIQASSDWIAAQGYEVIYGDTDSVFVCLRTAVSDAAADRIGQQLASDLNRWWADNLQQRFGIQSYLEMEYETHYQRFFMPSIRGADTGSKKRYAGLIHDADGLPHMVFKGLEAVRSDWTPLARQFQQQLYRKIFLQQPYSHWVRQQLDDLLAGHSDHLLSYRKRLRQPLAMYQRQIPPHARAAMKLDQWRQQNGLMPRYQQGRGWIRYRITAKGPEPLDDISENDQHDGISYPTAAPDYQHYIDKQLRPIAAAIFQFTGDDVDDLLGMQGSLFL
ncbi:MULTISPECIES: DNA polymerase II [unclassified Oceanobacter]|uniref:DNA polymerase II n=1 Tax=unclassified Oceanobacter TaxID=2620260 RepID=UPI002737473A|nr:MULTISPECIES: DNA polymerase II [unclassified Oceanobacter]MDP2609480.1 DNA polymerase II [Oceanobacter sp. 1_MG-2023]MDP2612820.1 DNA polymerase II [Oceanobacter sp. 2_MG-2023]